MSVVAGPATDIRIDHFCRRARRALDIDLLTDHIRAIKFSAGAEQRQRAASAMRKLELVTAEPADSRAAERTSRKKTAKIAIVVFWGGTS
jgi:hypothetical protein